MNPFEEYLEEIESRSDLGLKAKPIEDDKLINSIIEIILDDENENRSLAINFLIYNTVPGTTNAAKAKSDFLSKIIIQEIKITEISISQAFEQLSSMKGGPSVKVLIDFALGEDKNLAKIASTHLKKQVFLYENDIKRLEKAYHNGCKVSEEILKSYSKAEFFTNLPEVSEKIEIVTYVAGIGDISTDLLSPGNQAHSRSDRELHGKCFISTKAQNDIQILKEKHPDKSIMLVAEKGTMGVGSSRMSGVNNVALWTGKQANPYVPFINIFPIVAGTNGISPIFLTTVSVTGGIGINLKNWVPKKNEKNQMILDKNGEPVLQQMFSVDTGTILTIDTKRKKLLKNDEILVDISDALTPQKLEFIRAGGSYSVVFGKKIQSEAAKILNIKPSSIFAESKKIKLRNTGLTAVEKIFNKNLVEKNSELLYAGSDVRVNVDIVGSQDTTGLMTCQELESMAATVISPKITGAYQSGCHTASVWDTKAQKNIPKLMKFMNRFGLITARDPENKYPPLTDVIHKVLNDLVVDDWSIIIGGDSHTRMSKGVAFGADSGTVALALATGEISMAIPESVKVTFEGNMHDHMDFRDIVHATQSQMLKKFNNENIFQGKIIEVHIGTLPSDQAFTFTDWTAEMKAKASICISEDSTLVESLEIAKKRIQTMIEIGMDNKHKVLQKLVDIVNHRIGEIISGKKPALSPDKNANYYAELIVNLNEINEPMIADPDVNNIDISKRYTHDTIRQLSYYKGEKEVDLGFVGSCMVHKGDLKILSKMLKNLEINNKKVEFNAPLIVAAPTYNIIDELKQEGDWSILQKYSGFEFNDDNPKSEARTEYKNMMYLERPGCNLCMGNQEKAAKGDTVMATSTRLFQGRVVEDSERKKGESLLASTPVVVLSAILGRIPSYEEYKRSVKGIKLTKFAPPKNKLCS